MDNTELDDLFVSQSPIRSTLALKGKLIKILLFFKK